MPPVLAPHYQADFTALDQDPSPSVTHKSCPGRSSESPAACWVCGCSAQQDAHGERICFCDTCYGGDFCCEPASNRDHLAQRGSHMERTHYSDTPCTTCGFFLPLDASNNIMCQCVAALRKKQVCKPRIIAESQQLARSHSLPNLGAITYQTLGCSSSTTNPDASEGSQAPQALSSQVPLSRVQRRHSICDLYASARSHVCGCSSPFDAPDASVCFFDACYGPQHRIEEHQQSHSHPAYSTATTQQPPLEPAIFSAVACTLCSSYAQVNSRGNRMCLCRSSHGGDVCCQLTHQQDCHNRACTAVASLTQGCWKCGCSAPVDRLGERICFCDTCHGSGRSCEPFPRPQSKHGKYTNTRFPTYTNNIQDVAVSPYSNTDEVLQNEEAHLSSEYMSYCVSGAAEFTTSVVVAAAAVAAAGAGCLRCGCSSPRDRYGDRICFCDTCHGGGRSCLPSVPLQPVAGGKLARSCTLCGSVFSLHRITDQHIYLCQGCYTHGDHTQPTSHHIQSAGGSSVTSSDDDWTRLDVAYPPGLPCAWCNRPSATPQLWGVSNVCGECCDGEWRDQAARGVQPPPDVDVYCRRCRCSIPPRTAAALATLCNWCYNQLNPGLCSRPEPVQKQDKKPAEAAPAKPGKLGKPGKSGRQGKKEKRRKHPQDSKRDDQARMKAKKEYYAAIKRQAAKKNRSESSCVHFSCGFEVWHAHAQTVFSEFAGVVWIGHFNDGMAGL